MDANISNIRDLNIYLVAFILSLSLLISFGVDKLIYHNHVKIVVGAIIISAIALYQSSSIIESKITKAFLIVFLVINILITVAPGTSDINMPSFIYIPAFITDYALFIFGLGWSLKIFQL